MYNLKKHKFVAVLLLFVLFTQIVFAGDNQKSHILYQPDGVFKVGYQDFHWIDTASCPDPLAPSYKRSYFSHHNPNMCRELLIRVYYPAKSSTTVNASAYPSLMIQPLQTVLKSIKFSPMDVKRCDQMLNQLQLAASPNLTPLKQSWPLILFSPGAVDNADEASSMLIELASHGYMVAAVNGSFLTSLTFLHHRKVLANPNLDDAKHIVLLYQTKLADLRFVYQHILKLNQQKIGIFANINPNRIGLLGHSAGASAVLAMARVESSKIKAVVALDAPNQTNANLNLLLKQAGVTFPQVFDIFSSFPIPVMQIHSSDAAGFLSAPDKAFSMSKDNYLVSIQTMPTNNNYFKHMDYTDYALIKDESCMQSLAKHYHDLNQDNPLFPSWGYGDISGKQAQVILSQYLLAFYGNYLLNEQNASLKQCVPLTSDTHIQCEN